MDLYQCPQGTAWGGAGQNRRLRVRERVRMGQARERGYVCVHMLGWGQADRKEAMCLSVWLCVHVCLCLCVVGWGQV